MNWDALGAIAELTAAIGVIASLIFVGRQIRQNTRSMDESRRVAMGQSYQERAESRRQMHIVSAESDHLPEIETKLTAAGWPERIETLSQVERFRYRHLRWAGL